jgi:hypothetical protein
MVPVSVIQAKTIAGVLTAEIIAGRTIPHMITLNAIIKPTFMINNKSLFIYSLVLKLFQAIGHEPHK